MIESILFRLHKRQTIIWDILKDTGQCYGEQNKSSTKRQRLYNFIYVWNLKDLYSKASKGGIQVVKNWGLRNMEICCSKYSKDEQDCRNGEHRQ